MIYPIVVYGNPILKKEAEDIEKDEIDIKQLVADMFETMYHARGCGLAAPQIGKSINIFVIDTTEMEDDPNITPVKQAFINAEITDRTGTDEMFKEGCLSVPGINEDVIRKSTITITYLDEDFVEHTQTFDGMPARVIQHEYDHIMGKTFIDRLSPFKRTLLKGKLKDIIYGRMRTFYRTKPNK
ncbi:MAG: peptide deformylase [Bacteroidales bacterium]|jgi:peptide deformylase|nr:peptide deformylase [Bacteroidales bacterium]MBQ4477462.1 peptide deformylase [Bacteroidales bacterium]MCR5555766.1 peptide deformylase [Bacteroidales bacterium]